MLRYASMGWAAWRAARSSTSRTSCPKAAGVGSSNLPAGPTLAGPNHRFETPNVRRRPLRARTATLAFVAILAVLPASSATAQNIEPEYLEEMEALAAQQAVLNALSRVEDLDAWGMDLLVELTEIPAPPFMEEVRAARFAELLGEAGPTACGSTPRATCSG